jgi:hypothetical protein
MKCYLFAPGDCIESDADIPMFQMFDHNQPDPVIRVIYLEASSSRAYRRAFKNSRILKTPSPHAQTSPN